MSASNVANAFRLPVTPFPAYSENGGKTATLPDGFVDEEIIATLIESPFQQSGHSRLGAAHSDLALSSDENDFAGWAVTPSSPFRVIAEAQERIISSPPPVESEPGIGQPHQGSHRWWIAAVAGMSSAVIVSVLFNSFGSPADSGFAFLSRSLGALQSALGSLAP